MSPAEPTNANTGSDKEKQVGEVIRELARLIVKRLDPLPPTVAVGVLRNLAICTSMSLVLTGCQPCDLMLVYNGQNAPDSLHKDIDRGPHADRPADAAGIADQTAGHGDQTGPADQ